jgi:outer membrane protein OmpA-like peptidoglycan-associated protein
MNTKSLLAWLAYVAFLGSSIWWWNNKRSECNCGKVANVASGVAATTSTSSDLPLSFNWDKNAAIQGNGFANYKNEQTKNLGPTDTLLIKTWYYDGEPGGEQLALQRADAIKALYPNVTADRIKVVTEKRTGEDKYKTEKFAAAEFAVLPNVNSKVKMNGNKVTIYFASNAKAKDVEKEIDDYLNTLAAQMKANPAETVTATGYTDNVGDDTKNQTLSQSRADFVKSLLAAKGVDAAKVSTVGKGEADPIASNDKEEGRKQNRRVELLLNNQ